MCFNKPSRVFGSMIVLLLFLALLGLHCFALAFFSCGEQGLLFTVAQGLLFEVASLVVKHRL